MFPGNLIRKIITFLNKLSDPWLYMYKNIIDFTLRKSNKESIMECFLKQVSVLRKVFQTRRRLLVVFLFTRCVNIDIRYYRTHIICDSDVKFASIKINFEESCTHARAHANTWLKYKQKITYAVSSYEIKQV